MERQQLGPQVRVLSLNIEDVPASFVAVQVPGDHGTVQGIGTGVLELGQLAGGEVPGEVGLLLPGIAVVVLVLVDEGRALSALSGEVLDLRRHPTGVSLTPNLPEDSEAHHSLREVTHVASVAIRRLTIV